MKHRQVSQAILLDFAPENNHISPFFLFADALLRHWRCLLRFPSGMRKLCLPDVPLAKTKVISQYMTGCCRLCKHPRQHKWRSKAGDEDWKKGWQGDIETSKAKQKTPGPFWGNMKWWPRIRDGLCVLKMYLSIYQPLPRADQSCHSKIYLSYVLRTKTL